MNDLAKGGTPLLAPRRALFANPVNNTQRDILLTQEGFVAGLRVYHVRHTKDRLDLFDVAQGRKLGDGSVFFVAKKRYDSLPLRRIDVSISVGYEVFPCSDCSRAHYHDGG